MIDFDAPLLKDFAEAEKPFAGLNIGFVITGSFCTHATAIETMRRLVKLGAKVIPVLSENAATINTRFGKSAALAATVMEISGRDPILTIDEAEPLGPKKMCDCMVVAPCTGNTMAKLANSITDGVATMAVKSHIRGGGPVVLCVATNDALAGSAKNLGVLMNLKPYYFVPLLQDDAVTKPTSVVADFAQIPETVYFALRGKQIQPVIAGV